MNPGRGGPRSWLDALLGACLTVLAAAFVLHVAVGLVMHDWPWLVGIAAVVVLVLALVSFLRARQGGW